MIFFEEASMFNQVIAAIRASCPQFLKVIQEPPVMIADPASASVITSWKNNGQW